MYSDKVEVLRFETEPYRKHLTQNGTSVVRQNGSLHYKYSINNNNYNNNINSTKHIVYENGYHNALIEPETKPATTGGGGTALAVAAPLTTIGLGHSNCNDHHQPPSDPVVASVLHSRQLNPRPGRLLLENVNNRPQTMDRGTQANTDDAVAEAPSPPPPPPQSTSNDPTSNELYRNANISVTNQKLMTNGGDNSSVDSLNSADSAKRDSEESVIELAEFHQPMLSKDNIDGHINMNNGDGKVPGVEKSNGNVKEHPVDDEVERTSCGMECLYFAMQCCECSIM